MTRPGRVLIFGVCLLLGTERARGQDREAAPPGETGWREARTRVRARFGGRPGTFAHFGDSTTVSLAFWSPLPHDRKNAPPERERAYRLVEERLRPECWRDRKGPGFGNDGGQTIRWADENVKKWLAELNLEVALIMFGTNDLTAMERDEYREGLRAVVRRLLDNGTVAILNTIPPRHGHAGKAAAFADAAREVAREPAVPLVDYHAEILVPKATREATRSRDCLIECCLFANDRPKRFEDDPADTPQSFNGNHVGGIDVMYPTGWTIRDNVFIGIRGRTGNARGAIFLRHDARDCVVERNVIVDCDSGICLGDSHKPDDVPVHCTGVVERNNVLCRVPENGILADYTRDCAIVHNTVHDPRSRLGRLIRLVYDNDGLRVVNNLLSGPPPRLESGSRITMHDKESGDFTAAFVAPWEGNLRLTASATDAIDKAVPLAEVTTDIDQKPRGSAPDLGAHGFPGPRR